MPSIQNRIPVTIHIFASPQVAVCDFFFWICEFYLIYPQMKSLTKTKPLAFHSTCDSTHHIAFKIQNGPSTIKHTKWFDVAKTMPAPKITVIHLRKHLHRKYCGGWCQPNLWCSASLPRKLRRCFRISLGFWDLNSFAVNQRPNERTAREQKKHKMITTTTINSRFGTLYFSFGLSQAKQNQFQTSNRFCDL